MDTNSEIAKRSKKRLLMLLVLSALGTAVLRMDFVFLFVGMLPAMVAYLIDHDSNKYTSSTVAALNFSGVFPYAVDNYMQGSTFNIIEYKFSDPWVWLVMYGSAAIGWGIVLFSPMVASVVLGIKRAGRVMYLESAQAKYIEEWGEEVADNEKEY